MRVFAISDVHVDYEANKQWIAELSAMDYQDDLLILAGDVSDSLELLHWCFKSLSGKFRKVLFVPGNHELWVVRDGGDHSSLDKFRRISHIAEDCGVSMQAFHCASLSIVPLLSWYDYTFGEPGEELLSAWMDYRACRWPDHFSPSDITAHFLQLNESALDIRNHTVISFSHFLPRIDLMPSFIPQDKRFIYPVLGTNLLEVQIRRLKPDIHVYGHSHVNRRVHIDGISYINNAFAYPRETRIAAKKLVCIHET
ncbi:MAG: metallophosphoesterase [Burkholderiales bacterium RIFCSPLOWO2_02_FULL_57_36]|nr:MAG: metallophosphoesterase [Burkholderiales bacterium RIFCSPLOWO2_02_FULL_57_36]